MDVGELYRFLMGIFAAITAFYLSRTVRVLDQVEDKLDNHSERLVRLETRANLNERGA